MPSAGGGLAGSLAALTGSGVDRRIDATGKYVIPGGIDVHTHMELPFGGTFAKDTFETAPARRPSAARRRSSTSRSSRAAGPCARAWTPGTPRREGNAAIDYGFHMIMSDVNDATLAEMDALVAEGVTDFKLFTAYPGVFFCDDGAIFRACSRRPGTAA